MIHFFISDIQATIMNTRTFFLITIFTISLSCSSVKNEEFITSSINLNKIRFRNNDFKDLIIKSVEEFRNKNTRGKKSIVIFEISNRDSIPIIYLTNKFFLKSAIEEELDYNYYEAGIVYKGILIISKNNEYSFPNDFYEITVEKKKFDYLVGNNIDFCKEKIEYKNNMFNKIETMCTFDLYVD